MKIGLNLIATNKYIYFVPKILESIERFFFINEEVVVFIHTNMITDDIFSTKENIKIVAKEISHEPWPLTTLKRFHYFLKAKEDLEKCDMLFYIDVDSLFVGNIEPSMIEEKGIFATLHPCLFQGEGTPERNNLSTAYIPYNSNNSYFCGGFFGGSSLDFLEMCERIKENIDTDLQKGIIAIWHDESHLNKYLFINKPSLTFFPPFAVAENITQLSEESKIIFLDKKSLGGHDYFRN